MRRCVCCRDEADDILWQPFGPAPTPTERSAFTWPGAHTRGFPALPLCETCHGLLREGARLHFRTMGVWWHCEGTTLTREVQKEERHA
jgi:hypothetical protein